MNKILLITAALFFLIIFPYTKNIERFKADDLTWSLLNKSVSYKEFDTRIFSFKNTYNISPELSRLNNKQIKVKGFLKHHRHKDHIETILTENVSDVCFMCSHDEHSVSVLILPDSLNNGTDTVPDDTYVMLEGIFKIKPEDEHSLFQLVNSKLISIKEF